MPLIRLINSIKPVASFLRRIRNRMRRDMRRLYRNSPVLDSSAPLVLVWSVGGLPKLLEFEMTIGASLRLRGVRTHFILCDGPFAACVKREFQQNSPVKEWQRACAGCVTSSIQVADSFGLSYSFLGDLLTPEVKSRLRLQANGLSGAPDELIKYADVDLTRNVTSSVLRYLHGHPGCAPLEVVREYAYSALSVAAAAEEAIKRFRPARILMSHGIYTDWGPALRIAEHLSVPAMLWQEAYVPSSYFIQRVATTRWVDPLRITDEVWRGVAAAPLSEKEEKELDAFMSRRYPSESRAGLASLHSRLGLDDKKRTIGIFSHVNWDAVSDYGPMIHASFEEWLLHTLSIAVQVTELNWVVKIHPWEINQSTETGMHALILRQFPQLPPHVKIISASDPPRAMDVFDLVDVGVTVFGTIGVELAMKGKSVILAGEPHYSGKGFTLDPKNRTEYERLLRTVSNIRLLDSQQVSLARRYAHNLFLRRQIPLSIFGFGRELTAFHFDRRHELNLGEDPYLDFFCSQILQAGSGILPKSLSHFALEV